MAQRGGRGEVQVGLPRPDSPSPFTVLRDPGLWPQSPSPDPAHQLTSLSLPLSLCSGIGARVRRGHWH